MSHRPTEFKDYDSVTTIVGMFDKPGLRYWYGKYGTRECERVSRESKSFGSEVHSLVFENPVSWIESLRSHTVARNIVDWCNQAGVKKILVEAEVVSHKYKYLGHPDLICNLTKSSDPGRVWILDWKTDSTPTEKAHIYERWRDYALQLGGYVQAYYEMTGIKIEDGAMIRGVKDPNETPQLDTRFQYHNLYSVWSKEFIKLRKVYDLYKGSDKWKGLFTSSFYGL